MRAVDAAIELKRAVERAGGTVAEVGGEFRCIPRDALVVWRAFKELAEIDVRGPFSDRGTEHHLGSDADNDLLLFESGVSLAQPQVMHFSVTRQLTFYDSPSDNAEYLGMSMLSVDMAYPASPELAAVPTAQLWGHAGPALGIADNEHSEFGAAWTGGANDWIAAVEDHPAFRATVLEQQPQRIRFAFSDM